MARPEDILPDGKDSAKFKGEDVRKGTVGAFLANAKVVEGGTPRSPEYEKALADLVALIPKLKALGVFEVFEVKPGRVRKIVDSELGPQL